MQRLNPSSGEEEMAAAGEANLSKGEGGGGQWYTIVRGESENILQIYLGHGIFMCYEQNQMGRYSYFFYR